MKMRNDLITAQAKELEKLQDRHRVEIRRIQVNSSIFFSFLIPMSQLLFLVDGSRDSYSRKYFQIKTYA